MAKLLCNLMSPQPRQVMQIGAGPVPGLFLRHLLVNKSLLRWWKYLNPIHRYLKGRQPLRWLTIMRDRKVTKARLKLLHQKRCPRRMARALHSRRTPEKSPFSYKHPMIAVLRWYSTVIDFDPALDLGHLWYGRSISTLSKKVKL